MDKTFDFILNELNKAGEEHDIRFKGNVYLLQHPQKGFYMYEEGDLSKTLEFEKLEYVPVGLEINEPTKYLGSNKRIQWQKSLYIPIKSPNHMKFSEGEEKIKVIEEVVDKLHGNHFDYEGVRIGFKVDDIKRGQTLPINGNYYIMMIMRVYAEKIERGYFGKELKFEIKLHEENEYKEIDVIETDVGFGADFTETFDVTNYEPTKAIVNKGSVVLGIDFYLDDSPVEKEITRCLLSGDFGKTFDVKLTFQPFDISVEKVVAITQAGKANKKLSVMAINMQLREVI